MTATPRNIIPSGYASDGTTTEYTANNVRTAVQNFTATNGTASAATLTVNLVASGGTAGASNAVIDQRSIQAGETYDCPELAGKVLERGGSISVASDTASALVINASGVEFS